MRLPLLTLIVLIVGALAVSACGRRAALEKPSSSPVEKQERVAGPLGVPLGREDSSAARAAATDLEDGTLETQQGERSTSTDDGDTRTDRRFFLDGLLE
ncbi:hypothetical protein [Notoacmeibacter sp. MSK16QG-6]|uniref:hypothetical protein n=1 Tax=Notoacmeibacter sp. MSK16QG-6 TaxID=2957982 RepID=UPI00209F06BA|nr:hypothetical protein [Notoacmeibacter sp. MSK16QG-6]MCP1199977.1 hypothetical protein [Notoacmeibacter sp. MSK16QG-6]